jgi:endonuclease/exonuclease/phosphatase family metal-dependent hydrolase
MGGTIAVWALLAGVATAQIRIVDWNIDRGKRLDALAATIRKLNPDICVLQEVDSGAKRTAGRDIAKELSETFQMHYVFGRAFRELGQGTPDNPAYLGQAILSRLPVRSSRVLLFERQTKFWKPQPYLPNWPILQRRTGGRIALVAEFGREATEFVVYNLHLESRGFGATRYGQLGEVIADAKRYGPEVPVVIAGDLNTKYRPGLFARRLKEAGFRNCFGDRKVRTHVLYGALDWIFVRGPAECGDTRVIRGSKASDHDALVTALKVPPAGSRANGGNAVQNISR